MRQPFSVPLRQRSLPAVLLGAGLTACLAWLLPMGVSSAQTDALTLEGCDARLRDGRPALALRFNQALSGTQGLEPLLTVHDLGALPQRGLPDANPPANETPPNSSSGPVLPPAWVLDRQGQLLWYTAARPARRYEVKLNAQLQAASGTTLGQSTQCQIDSPAMPPSFAFASTGVVLPAGRNGGLPIVTVNVPEVDVEFLRLRPEGVAVFFDKVLGYRLTSASSDDAWRWRSNRNMQGEISNWDLDSLAGITQSVFQGRFQTDSTPDQRTNTYLPIESLAQLQEPGIYLAVMSEPGRFRYEQQVTYFYVSDIGLHVHQHPSQIAVFLTSLSQARPLADLTVHLRDAKGEILSSATSDDAGRVLFEGRWPQARLVSAQRGEEQSLLALSQPALDLSEFPVTGLPDAAVRWFIWSGRQLYRPGEELTVSVLQRDADGRLASATPAHARWKQADGRVVREATWEAQAQPQGYLQASFSLPPDAQTGTWQLELRRDPGSPQADAVWNFRVEEFLPERMQLHLEPKLTQLTPEDSWELAALGSWRFGAPAAGNRVQFSLQRQNADDWMPEQWPGFRFGDQADTEAQPWLEMPEVELDAEGRGLLAAPASTLSAPGASRWIATARLLDAGGRPVVRQARAQWWPAPVLLAIRPEFAKDTTSEGGSARFDIIRVNAQGELQPSTAITARLIREHREYHWRYDDQSGWNSAYVDLDEPMETLELDLSQGRNQLALPVAWGRYRLELHDPETGEMLRYRFYAGWDAAQAETLGGRPDRVELQVSPLPIADGTRELQATITPPHDGSAVITLETDRVLWSTRLPVSAAGTQVSIPWPEGLAQHDAYLGVVVFRPAGDGLGRASTPSRAVGLAYLPLDRSQRELKVQLEHPPKVQPGTKLPLRIQVPQTKARAQASVGNAGAGAGTATEAEAEAETGADEAGTEAGAGAGAQARTGAKAGTDTGAPLWATISLVDTGILDLDPRPAPSPIQYFFGQQRYGGAWRDLYGRMIERLPGAAARLNWGGDAAPGLNPDVAIPVRIIDLFQGPITLDAQGEAQLELDLPEFNGELELRVTVFSAQDYGSTQSTVVLAAPWIAEAAAPRYLRTGDRSQVLIDWHHREGEPKALNWQLQSEGAITANPTSGQIELEVGARFGTPIEVQAGPEPGSGWLHLQAPAHIDQSLALPVLPSQAKEQQWQWLRVAPGQTLSIPGFSDPAWLAAGLQIQLLAMDEPDLGWQAWAADLLGYPYHCAEQTVSRAYPWLWLSPEQQAEFQSTQLEPAVALGQAVMRLAGLQTAGGGFAMWPGGDADPWISAWTMGFLLDLAKHGQTVPGEMLEQGRSALLAQLRAAPAALQELPEDSDAGASGAAAAASDQIWANEAHARLAAAALAAAVLAPEGQAPLATLRQLWEQHAKQARSPLPLMHLAVALQAMGDQKRAVAAAEAALNTPYAVGWRSAGTSDFGSRLRDLVWSYALALQHNLLVDERERWLAAALEEMNQRPASSYSTQEWQALLQAGLAQGQLSAGAPSATAESAPQWELRVAGQAQSLTPQNPSLSPVMTHAEPARRQGVAPTRQKLAAARKPQDEAAQLHIHNTGTQAAWLQVRRSGYPAATAPGTTAAAQTLGLSIERRWFLPDGTPWTGGQLHSGDALVVRLDVSSEQALSQALIVDPLPAGLALDNLNLLPPDSLPEVDYDGAFWQASLNDPRVHQREYRDDRYVAALDVEGEITLLYRVQVLNPGRYQVPPATIQAMYVPGVRSQTAAAPALEVKAATSR